MGRPAARRRTTAGHTLIEIVITGGVFAVISTGLFSLMRDAGGVFHSALRASAARRHCSEVTTSLASEICGANPADLAIDTSHTEGDRLLLQLPLSVTNGVVEWGGTTVLGRNATTQANAFVSYRLVADPAQPNLWCLVRRLVAAGGGALAPEQLLVDHVDAVDAQRGKGFAVARSGDLVTLTLRVRESADDATTGGSDVVRSHQITVKLRNL
jgi:hypothetical protein